MKALIRIGCLISLALLAASCQFPGTKIRPGDRIGGMEFLNDYAECPAPNFNDICGGFESLEEGTCEIPAELTMFWVSTGWAEETQDALELAWKDSEWSLTFDDYVVDLPAFGTFGLQYDGQPARAWNVCISNPAPGTHTVVYKIHFEHGSRPGNHTNVLTFSIPTPAPGQTQ